MLGVYITQFVGKDVLYCMKWKSMAIYVKRGEVYGKYSITI